MPDQTISPHRDPSSAAPSPWWLSILPKTRELDTEGQRLALSLRSLVANAGTESRTILAHAIWSLAACDQLGENEDGVLLHLTGTWIRAGRECSTRQAYLARDRVIDAVGGELLTADEVGFEIPDRRATYPLIRKAVISAVVAVVPWLVQQGWLLPPLCGRAPTKSEDAVPWIEIPTPRLGNSKITCPSPDHEDRHPSAYTLWDGQQGGCRCLACEKSFMLRADPAGVTRAAPAGTFGIIEEQDEEERETGNKTTLPGSPGIPLGLVYVNGALSSRGMKKSMSESASRESADKWSASHRGNELTWARACHASWVAQRHDLNRLEVFPDRFESIGVMRPYDWKVYQAHYGEWWAPLRFRPAGTERVLIDLDGLDPLTLDSMEELPAILTEARERAERDPMVRGVDLLMTSDHGVHLRISLSGFEKDERTFYRCPRALAWLWTWGEWLRERLARGGRVDPASWAPGRFQRKVGWRLQKDGTPFLVRFVDELPARSETASR